MNDYDVAVIGGSAAGLSAALVLARARRRVVVIDAGSPRNAPAAHMHGYLSRDGLPPSELLAVGQAEVRSYDGEVLAATVSRVVPRGVGGFSMELSDGAELSARRVLIATGLSDELPEVDGLRERWARDVLHCPYCHGWEVRNQRLGVIGGSPEAVKYTQIVRQWSSDIVYFTPPEALNPRERAELLARAVSVVEGEVARVIVVGRSDARN